MLQGPEPDHEARRGNSEEGPGMTSKNGPEAGEAFVEHGLNLAIRIGLVLLLIAWCFTVVRPFVAPIIWGIIIAVATHPVFVRLQWALRGRRGPAAAVYVVVFLVVLIAPALLLAGTLVDAVRFVAADLSDGVLDLPPPPAAIEAWPLIGEPLHRFWELASTNLQAALSRIGPELKVLGRWLLSFVGQVAVGLLQFVIAIFIAAGLLVNAAGGGRVADDVATRLIGDRGPSYAGLARATIRSVAYGILGVALIQSILAGLGFLAVGLPGAGLLALICLLLIVVQIGPGLVMVPVVIYEFYVADTTTAILFAVWCFLVTILDNVLKPFLLGRGVQVPLLIIFVGAIGGVLSSGILGLFVGPVVLALGYTLFVAWLREGQETAPETPAAPDRP